LSPAWIESHPAVVVPIDSLLFDGSPRLGGEDLEHVRMLAEASAALPPIMVHAPTMRVIDGVHRVRAARLNRLTEIRARMLHCDEQAAFILAVKANISHGLPLSKDDRTTAAIRIIVSHPDWSDRAVAAVTGLSDKTVSRIRVQSGSATLQPGVRIGRDGRIRPLDTTQKREQAAAMISEGPRTGLREIARATGLSLATVQDVRQRVNRGEDPVPSRYRLAKDADAATRPSPQPTMPRTRYKEALVDQQVALEKLDHDPSLKFNEAGRQLLHWLHRYTLEVDGAKAISTSVPDHWTGVVSALARTCATAWIGLADILDERPLGSESSGSGSWNSGSYAQQARKDT
jgi:ParB-like chromosome segregation protein Spo0J